MLKVAIIGPGNIAHTYMQALADSEKVKVTAVLGRREETAKPFAEKYGISCYTDSDAMYSTEKPDAVLICTPTFTHEDIVKKAIEKQVHIMCEKPFVLDAEVAENLFALADKNNVRIMVMQVVRFWPEYVYIKQLADSGKLGNITNVYAHRLSAHPDWCSWHKDPQKSGGGLYDLHIHDIDWLCHVFGRVKSVYAVGMQTENGCWNNVSSVLDFECGVSAVAEGFMDITGSWDFCTNIRINGSSAAVEYLNKKVYNSKVDKININNLVIYHKNKDAECLAADVYNPYKLQTEYFADCVTENRKFDIVPPKDIVYVLKVLKAIEKSLQTHLVQKVDE
ncbi:MAG: Gfo/Idh/MocA family oxidoreductase [Oscillospiraceae bacterium]|nr:Gfo/Idh/MocA family oxidoreductase [Oscillospiraceae bacterium]